MSENLVTMIFEIDQEVYDQVVPLFESLGTTIEDMAAGFIKFSVIPENLPLLKAYLGIENGPLRKFCVSVFRQNQEYHIINVHDWGLFPLATAFPGGWDGMRAGTA